MLHLLRAPLPLPLQLPLLLLQAGLQLGDALAQPVLVQQAVGVLQLQAVAAPQGLLKKGGGRSEEASTLANAERQTES